MLEEGVRSRDVSPQNQLVGDSDPPRRVKTTLIKDSVGDLNPQVIRQSLNLHLNSQRVTPDYFLVKINQA
jgi:hypothetical protein